MAIQESEYDEFSAPIPGQSLTDEPQNYPWEQPPRYTDFEEIAEITKMNETAIRVALSRVRKKIREELLKKHNYGIK